MVVSQEFLGLDVAAKEKVKNGSGGYLLAEPGLVMMGRAIYF